MDADGRVIVKFPLIEDPLGLEAEWMWAMPLGENKFRVENSPFHVYGVSHLDVFFADIVDDVFLFRKICKKSGHRTVRVRLPRSASHSQFESLWPQLSALGCSYEGSQIERPLYAIDLPPSVDLDEVIGVLQGLEEDGLLEYEEADCF